MRSSCLNDDQISDGPCLGFTQLSESHRMLKSSQSVANISSRSFRRCSTAVPFFLCKPLLANKTDHLNKVNVDDIRELVDKQGLQQALNPSAVKLTAGEFLVGRSGRTEARQIAGQVGLTRSTVTSGVWMWDAWNIPSTVIMQNVRWRAYTHTHTYIYIYIHT